MARVSIAGLSALLAFSLSVANAASQTPRPKGWLGVAYALQVTRSERGTPRVRAIVTEVMAGSPAAEAGVRAGDAILRINGREVTPKGLGVIDLQSGDTVSLVVEHAGARRQVTVRAASRPSTVPRPPLPPEASWTLHPSLDSVAEAMYRAMDSLRVRLRGGAAQAEAAARAAAAARAVEARLPSEAIARAEGIAELRPLAPYILGQNRALGAEVLDLKPELAAYFQVAAGVLVVDVPEDSPAADAGLAPGDVITAVSGRPVRSLRDLRSALSGASARTALTVVRKGLNRTVRMRR